MIEKLLSLFRKPKVEEPEVVEDIAEEVTEPEPEIGEIRMLSDGSPWPKNNIKVEVLDVKMGWVRFRWLGSRMCQDERLELFSFNHIYKPIP